MKTVTMVSATPPPKGKKGEDGSPDTDMKDAGRRRPTWSLQRAQSTDLERRCGCARGQGEGGKAISWAGRRLVRDDKNAGRRGAMRYGTEDVSARVGGTKG